MDNTYAVIMAGGRGQRFWPLSTAKHPKQLLSLIGEKPLIAMAVERLDGLIPVERILVVTSADLVKSTLSAAPSLLPYNVVGEPCGRDTAAAVALSSALVKARDPKAVFCILTADHVIGDLDVFRATLREGMALAASDDLLLTIGIIPTFPSTGFGYIRFGDRFAEAGGIEFARASQFVEKPDGETARRYLASGHYCWNSGMFIWSVSSIQRALQQYQPDLFQMAERVLPRVGKPGFGAALAAEYEPLRRVSVDYAVMEHADNIIMAKGTFRWQDVGSWSALAEHFPADAGRNVVVGDGVVADAENNVVVSRGRLTALLGVRDLVVVQAEGVTLVCPRDRAQEVKTLVDLIEAGGRYNHLL